MNRRRLLSLAAACLLLPVAGMAEPLVYRPGLVEERLAAGDTVFVDFYTDWCTTCRAQHRVIDALLAENPAYEAEITFIKVDWDIYSDDPLSVRLNIPRRSTLVVLKGNMQLGRIVAGTARDDIKALLDAALAAARS